MYRIPLLSMAAETMIKQNKYPELRRQETSVIKMEREGGGRSTSATSTIPVKKVLIISHIFGEKLFRQKKNKTSMIVSPSIEPCRSLLQFLLFCASFCFVLFFFFFSLLCTFVFFAVCEKIVGIPSLSVRYTRGDPFRSQ